MIKIISPFDDTPAYKAGILPGDLIVAIDNKLTKNLSTTEVVNMLRGKPNTDVTLTIFRPGKDEPIQITLTRAIISIYAVKEKMIDHDIGYVRLAIFNESTVSDVYNAIKRLQKMSKNKMNGLVIDVRNNPGGILDSVVDVTDLFLDARRLGENKTIVYTKGRAKGSSFIRNATNGDMLNNLPIAILINQGSASASEILAAALQDHQRAIIVGTQSFGKGSVQSVIAIDDFAMIKLTTSPLLFTKRKIYPSQWRDSRYIYSI